MAEVSLEGARIVLSVRQSEIASMPEHVRVGLKDSLGPLSCTFEHSGEPGCGEWRSALGREHKT
jgi:hypothetical protein